MKLLKFHAEWCEPCKRADPLIEALAMKAGVPVESIDIDQQPEMARHHLVMSVPTVILLSSTGTPVFTGVGLTSLPGLRAALA